MRTSPLIAKELRPLLRSRRAFWLLLLALLASGGTFGFIWLNYVENVSASTAAFFGRLLFFIVSGVLLGVLGLVSPILTATAIASEREHNTLDLLVATGLSRRRILLGKLAASLAYQFIFILCMLPVLILPFHLGGIGGDEIIFAVLLIAVSVLTYGMLGLAVSCWVRRSAAALVLTLLLVLLLTVIIPVAGQILESFNIIDREVGDWGFPFSPLAVMEKLVTDFFSNLNSYTVNSSVAPRGYSGPAPLVPALILQPQLT